MTASSLPNMAWASALANSVFPTPVGPKKTKLPIGRLGFFSPARALLTARATALTASSWPTTLLCRISSRFTSRSLSSSASLLTGIPVQLETIAAISSSPTVPISRLRLLAHSLRSLSICSFSFCSSSRNWAAFSYSWALIASSFSLISSCSRFSHSLMSSGTT